MSEMIPFVDLKAQYNAYRAELDEAMAEVLAHGRFIMGPEVAQLEEALGAFSGARHAITCANGTDALQLCLMALDIGPGDEVIVPTFTFIATAEVIPVTGAKPVFVDIREDDYTIDCKRFEEAITANTKAVIPVSLFGQPADMDEINAVAGRHNIAVIEDAAQSFGASYKGRKSGSLSRLATTSFFPAKPLGCYGDGGAIFTADDDLADRMRRTRVHGQAQRYRHTMIGINSRLDTLQAAILLVKLAHFQDELDQRQAVADRYTAELRDLELSCPSVHPERTSAWAQYSIRVNRRDSLREELSKRGIPSAVHYPIPLHQQPAFQAAHGEQPECPVAEAVCKSILSLPLSAFLTLEHQSTICDAVRDLTRG